ncbi:MAG: class I SAM-dependent methyltransferase [Candidatus Helarchaeota archaeon]
MNDSDIQHLLKATEKVKGWLLDKEAIFLYNTAKNCNDNGVIVEIGSWHGKSTIWLGKGSIAGNNIKIYSIDPHTGSSEHKDWYGKVWTFDIFKKNIADFGIDNIIEPIVKTSKDASKDWNNLPIVFLWIDGAHEYEYVLLDYLLWEPYLIDNGIIAFHDTLGFYKGPKKVVYRYLFMGNKFKNIGFIGAITYAIKTNKITIMDKIKNRLVYLLKKLYILVLKINLLGGNFKIVQYFVNKFKITNYIKYFK